jgi:hypothetical protein
LSELLIYIFNKIDDNKVNDRPAPSSRTSKSNTVVYGGARTDPSDQELADIQGGMVSRPLTELPMA